MIGEDPYAYSIVKWYPIAYQFFQLGKKMVVLFLLPFENT